MRVLVTGATGFVGQYLVRLLASRRHTVFGTYLVPPTEELPIGVELLACDMRERNHVAEVLRHAQPQRVYHLAGLSSVTKSFTESRHVWNTNLGGVMNLLDAVRESAPKARVLLVGSGQCYGNVAAARLPVTEDQPLAPHNPYAGSKAAADLMGYQYFRSWNLHVVRARPFNHTGPGQPPQYVCSDLARQVAKIDAGLCHPVLQVGNTRVQRDFSDVRDVVSAYELLLEHGQSGDAYNIASGRGVSIAQIVRLLRKFCRRPFHVEVQQQRLRMGETPRLYGSNRKLRRHTGWKPEYSLSHTMKDVYTHWRTALAAGSAHASI
ncbi:MAG TPA: GDP-mannose 4,6-dehydratase [Terriglobales bacterium]|nr:GDP-mannose 4,6-dehydratase [Terriglobales bacterium]